MLRPRRRPRRGGHPAARACGASSGRRWPTSSSSWWTTARPTRRRRCSPPSTTRASSSCATSGTSASPRRSTAGSSSPRDAGSRGSTRTTSPCRERLERQLALVGAHGPVSRCSAPPSSRSTRAGVPGARHAPPVGAAAVRWHALCSSPFFHPTVLVDREALDRHGLRYDERLGESEDYELWTRLLAVAEGDNSDQALTLRRVHPGQATRRRGDLQRSIQRDVALREIAQVGAVARSRRRRSSPGASAQGSSSSRGASRRRATRTSQLLEAVVRLRPADAQRRPPARGAPARADWAPTARRAALRLDPLLPLARRPGRRGPPPRGPRRARARAVVAPRARRGAAGPRHDRLARADPVPLPAPRPGRRAARGRPHRRLRGGHRRRAGLGRRRAAAPRGVPGRRARPRRRAGCSGTTTR